MFGLIGIAVILLMVFGGYVIHGGHLEPILHALPFEMIMIGGAAIGAFLISNDLSAIKQTLKDVGKVFKGNKWKPADYRDLLCLLFELVAWRAPIRWRWRNMSRIPKTPRSSESIPGFSTTTIRSS
jgi:chemotaxis protein MotA